MKPFAHRLTRTLAGVFALAALATLIVTCSGTSTPSPGLVVSTPYPTKTIYAMFTAVPRGSAGTSLTYATPTGLAAKPTNGLPTPTTVLAVPTQWPTFVPTRQTAPTSTPTAVKPYATVQPFATFVPTRTGSP